MIRSKITVIRNWIKNMGFELVKSYTLSSKSTRVNYYVLEGFGVYEEIVKHNKGGKKDHIGKRKFISWTPWGVDFEVNSVNDLSEAYQAFLSYNPKEALNPM